jgi:uridine kinase
MFNSALDYEMSALKIIAEPQLRQVKPTNKYHKEAVRLLHILDYFLPINHKYVPPYSLLRFDLMFI